MGDFWRITAMYNKALLGIAKIESASEHTECK